MAVKSLKVAERVFQRETASLPQYLNDAWPWVDPTDPLDIEAAELVRSIINEENEWIERLARLIESRGGVPLTGSYPAEFTDTHYLALEFLLKRLIAYQRWNMEQLEADLEAAADDPELRNILSHMLERKREQTHALEELLQKVMGGQPAPAQLAAPSD